MLNIVVHEVTTKLPRYNSSLLVQYRGIKSCHNFVPILTDVLHLF